MSKDYPVVWLLEFAKIKRSSYYKWRSSKELRFEKAAHDQVMKERILTIHLANKEFGYPNMTAALREEGILINHKKVYRLMRELRIQSIIRPKRKIQGQSPSRIFDNIVNQQFKNRVENEVLVTDITEVPYENGKVYLSVIQDIYNNEIVSWRVSDFNNLPLVLDTLDGLLQKRNVYRTILHSDQGFQYTSHEYIRRLALNGIIGSHSRKGNCHDNACIESFFSHFKSEMLYLHDFKTREELVQAIETYIYKYNYKRFQKRLNHRSPVEYRLAMAA